MKVAVTGGGGFIGSHLAERFVDAGHDVVVLDNFSTGRRENLGTWHAEVRLVEGDIRSYERVHTALRDCEMVFHQAALPSVPRSVQDPLTSVETNVTGTLNVLLNARDVGARRVIFASSSSVYGAEPTLPKREDAAPLPMSPYAVSKLAGEGFCRSFEQIYGLECVALRYFNVFGPRQDPSSQYAAVIPNFITACLTGTSPEIFGDGEQSRDFTYVDNVIAANFCAMEAERASGVYNIACGTQTTLNTLLATIADLLGVEIEAVRRAARPGDVRHSLADITRAGDLGYRPVVDLREGLSRTADHLVAARRAPART
jgi:nucleoside-diphosphate-sugar epimerase